MSEASSADPERALVLAPLGRDSRIAAAILGEAGIAATICADLTSLQAELEAGAGVALIAEEALYDQDYSTLSRWVDGQPAWSDFPMIVLTQRSGGIERNPTAGRILQALGNVTFLERPFHPTTLVSVVQTALRGRRRQYEARERLEAIRSAEEAFRTLAENIPTLCWMARPDGHVFWYNLRWHQYTGTTPEDPAGWGWEAVHDPAVLPEVEARWSHSLATGEPFEMTFPLRGADGVFRPFLTRIVPLRDETGAIVRWFGTNTDVSRQQQDQQHLRLMVNELNHRVKNTLATVQSIVAQTLRGADAPPRLLETLTARILALSRAHDVLTDEQWSGADLREIAAQTALPHQDAAGEDRIVLSGPEVRLPPKTAIAVALAFHELATNAAKYGALSSQSGRVELTWSMSGQEPRQTLRIVWREYGGPPVKPPSRVGFGTRLIERGLATDLRGSVVLEYPPEGAVCTIEAKLDPPQGHPIAFAPADAAQDWPSAAGRRAAPERSPPAPRASAGGRGPPSARDSRTAPAAASGSPGAD